MAETIGAEATLERVAEIARELAEAHSIDELLQRIVDLGAQHLERCDGVSVMVVQRRGGISTPAYSTETARASDQAQYEVGQGPCLTSMAEHRTIVIDDLHADHRWPRFAERVADLGIRSMCSIRLFLEADTMGALNFHAGTPYAFERHDVLLGEVFASHAAVALRAAITETGLEIALRSRDIIGQAKGIIMSQESLTGDQAFDRLRTSSQHLNRPLRDIAQDVVRTGQIPVPEPSRRDRNQR